MLLYCLLSCVQISFRLKGFNTKTFVADHEHVYIVSWVSIKLMDGKLEINLGPDILFV